MHIHAFKLVGIAISITILIVVVSTIHNTLDYVNNALLPSL